MAEVKWKPAGMTDLVADILETFSWQFWSTDELMFEVARIRRCAESAVSRASVRSAARRLVESGRAVGRGGAAVRYCEDGERRMYNTISVRWEEQDAG